MYRLGRKPVAHVVMEARKRAFHRVSCSTTLNSAKSSSKAPQVKHPVYLSTGKAYATLTRAVILLLDANARLE